VREKLTPSSPTGLEHPENAQGGLAAVEGKNRLGEIQKNAVGWPRARFFGIRTQKEVAGWGRNFIALKKARKSRSFRD